MGDREIHPVTRRRMPTGPRVLDAVHDELVGEVPAEMDTPELDWVVRSCMTTTFGLKVPLSSSSERSETSWDDVHPV
jgi:DNA polymerase I-like protein with 3'-5' exonuclease and polymerase domains